MSVMLPMFSPSNQASGSTRDMPLMSCHLPGPAGLVMPRWGLRPAGKIGEWMPSCWKVGVGQVKAAAAERGEESMDTVKV